MSTARQEIAAAANTVAGISCTEYYRQTTKAGDAMVRLDRTEYPDTFGGLDAWQVVVVLPQDVEAAEKSIELRQPQLVAALGDVMAVRRAFPGQFAYLDGATVPALFIEGQRESE